MLNVRVGPHIDAPLPLTADVLSEEAILKWYSDAHLSKGKSVFLEQMKKFVEWLKNAEEGNGNSLMSPFHVQNEAFLTKIGT